MCHIMSNALVKGDQRILVNVTCKEGCMMIQVSTHDSCISAICVAASPNLLILLCMVEEEFSSIPGHARSETQGQLLDWHEW